MIPVSEDYLSRGGDTASPWRYLPGTRAEAEAVSTLLSSSNITNTLYTGAAGNEESFKSLSGQAPSILHIATHGFYLQETDFQSSVSTGVDIRGHLQTQKSALKRSGLIMSGANPAWTEGRILPNVEDGILTAEEISQLDLRNTSLVIVSACDSGLGEINNDGVEGLQRAFKVAGVNSLVVTLWKVDDSATELMMKEFYKNLTNGSSRRKAFDLARSAVKSKYPEPFYWAPFVMID
jgi:CHAT domain-containing protein